MADAPLTPSDDQQDQPLRQLQEGNGNGNDGDSRTRSRFDDTATASDDDDGSSLGSGGTGSEAADEDRGFTAGTDLDVGRMTLAGGDQQPAATSTAADAATATAALAAMTLTDTATAAAAGKTKIEADAEAGDDDEDEVEAPPAATSEGGTATIATGSKVILRQGKHELALPVEVLGDICKFLPYGERAAGGTRSIAKVVSKSLDSNDEKACWRSFLHRNFSALEIAYVLCRGRRTRERGMDILDEWEKHNGELVASCFKVPAAEALKSPVITSAGNGRINHVRIFRCPREALFMDHPVLLLRAIRQGHLDVFGDSPFVRNDDERSICEFGIHNLISLAMTIASQKCLSALLDLAAGAARPALTDPDGWSCLHSVILKILRNTILCPLLVQLQLAEVVLHHEVCDINALDSVGYTALHVALLELWRLGRNDFLDRFGRCLVLIAMLVKAGADIDREGGVSSITPQDMAIRMAESDDEAVVARGVLALEVLNGRLLVNEDISGIIAKSNALAGVLSFL